MSDISYCQKCGRKLNKADDFCPGCGRKIRENDSNGLSDFFKKNDKYIYICILIIIFVIIIFASYSANKPSKPVNKVPPKVNISMTNYYGDVDYIINDLGLDFNEVTMGANCLSGVVSQKFETEKYGVLHTEFRYCESNKTKILKVYNTESDQKLRDPEPGEVPQFDSYGSRK